MYECFENSPYGFGRCLMVMVDVLGSLAVIFGIVGGFIIDPTSDGHLGTNTAFIFIDAGVGIIVGSCCVGCYCCRPRHCTAQIRYDQVFDTYEVMP